MPWGSSALEQTRREREQQEEEEKEVEEKANSFAAVALDGAESFPSE